MNKELVNKTLDIFNESKRSEKDKKAMELVLKTAQALTGIFHHLPPEHFPMFKKELDTISSMHRDLNVPTNILQKKILEVIKEYYFKIPTDGMKGDDELTTYR